MKGSSSCPVPDDTSASIAIEAKACSVSASSSRPVSRSARAKMRCPRGLKKLAIRCVANNPTASSWRPCVSSLAPSRTESPDIVKWSSQRMASRMQLRVGSVGVSRYRVTARLKSIVCSRLLSLKSSMCSGSFRWVLARSRRSAPQPILTTCPRCRRLADTRLKSSTTSPPK